MMPEPSVAASPGSLPPPPGGWGRLVVLTGAGLLGREWAGGFGGALLGLTIATLILPSPPRNG